MLLSAFETGGNSVDVNCWFDRVSAEVIEGRIAFIADDVLRRPPIITMTEAPATAPATDAITSSVVGDGDVIGRCVFSRLQREGGVTISNDDGQFLVFQGSHPIF